MYIVISWDISASQPLWSQIDERLRNCFDGLPNFRPVNTFYLVKVGSIDHRNQLRDRLQSVAKSSSVEVRFVISPAMSISSWDGWLYSAQWTRVSAVTG